MHKNLGISSPGNLVFDNIPAAQVGYLRGAVNPFLLGY
jgi:hypothetical protein